MSRRGTWMGWSVRAAVLAALLLAAGIQAADARPDGEAAPAGALRAGAARVDITPPVGVPLGGYGGGARRLARPDLDPFDYHTLLAPSEGVLDPLYARALVLADGEETVALVSVDAIGVTNEMLEAVHREAARRGVDIPVERLLVFASHTHSGPGAVTRRRFWELAAMDLYHPRVARSLFRRVAEAVVLAQADLGPALLATGAGTLPGATRNRRAGASPFLDRDDVDPEMGIIQVERPDRTPIATVWNFAVHGTCLGASNLLFSGDIMGNASARIETAGGGVALFANGAEGDIAPSLGVEEGGALLSRTVAEIAFVLLPRGDIDIRSASTEVDFGRATLRLDRSRVDAGDLPPEILDLAGPILDRGVEIPLPRDWTENRVRFQAVRLGGALVVSVPGEALHEVGLEIKEYGRAAGYDPVLVFGLANGHLGYIAPEREYEAGGYEALMTLYGPHTADRVLAACREVIDRLRAE